MPLIGWIVCTSGSLVLIASTFVSPCLQVACAGTLYQGSCSCACIRSRDARRGVKWASTVERVAVHLYLKLPSPSVAPYKQDTTRTGRDGGVVSITTLTSSRTANVRCTVPVLHRVLRHREFRYLIEVVEQVGDMLPYGSFVISSLGVGCTRQHITAG